MTRFSKCFSIKFVYSRVFMWFFLFFIFVGGCRFWFGVLFSITIVVRFCVFVVDGLLFWVFMLLS